MALDSAAFEAVPTLVQSLFSHNLSVQSLQTNCRAFKAVLTLDSVDKRLSNFLVRLHFFMRS